MKSKKFDLVGITFRGDVYTGVHPEEGIHDAMNLMRDMANEGARMIHESRGLDMELRISAKVQSNGIVTVTVK